MQTALQRKEEHMSKSNKASRSAEIERESIEFKERGGSVKVYPLSGRGRPNQAGGPRDSWARPRSDGDRWGQPRYREFAALSPDSSIYPVSRTNGADDRIGKVIDARSRFKSGGSKRGGDDTGSAAAA